MHELSIAENIMNMILEELPKYNISKVRNIRLKIGEFRQIIPESLLFGFECITPDTPLEGVHVNIEHVTAKGRCLECHQEFILENLFRYCPSCESLQVEIIAGKELEIVEFEGE